MYRRRLVIYVTAMATALLLSMSLIASADSVPRISTDELKSRLGEEGLVVLDVRANQDWLSSNDKIAGAVRADPNDVNLWRNNYSPDDTIVFYCA